MLRSLPAKLAIAIVFFSLSTQSHALDDQWYLGIGGGTSLLAPNPDIAAIDRNSDTGTVGTIILGRDFDSRSSAQFQLSSLGEIEFDNNQTAQYSAAEAALLYRFFDSRDNRRGNSVFGASIYGRFGLGFIDRDTPVAVANDTPVYIGAGAGIETYFTRNLGIRLEAQYLDTDASVGTVSLIGRFGGLRRDLARRPPPATSSPSFPARAPLPTTQVPQNAQLPETAELPESFRRPETIQLPTETAQVPPQQAQQPETAQLPEVAQLPQTVSEPDTTQLPETAQLPQVALLPESDQPAVDTRSPIPEAAANATPAPTLANSAQLTDSTSLPDVEIMVDAVEISATDIADVDGDGIVNELDSCALSPPGFPVGNDGCSLFGEEIEGVRFESDSVTLVSDSTKELDFLARLLVQFPEARIELVSHTDTTGSETEQSRRTRGRLQSIGLYLVNQGVRSRQLVLRSFAAERPKFDNGTEQGRRANNRVEVFEKPR